MEDHAQPAATAPGQQRSRSRGELLRGAALAGAAFAGITAAGLPRFAGAAPSPEQDVEVLNLLLLVEYTEVALYSSALESGALKGELRSYAHAALEHERAHLSGLKQVLGDKAVARPGIELGDASRDAGAFADAAVKLEDVAVGAYNGQAANVTPEAFVAAAKIVSVEARHAAWVRSIVGKPPAPDTTDSPLTAAQVRERLRALGVKP